MYSIIKKISYCLSLRDKLIFIIILLCNSLTSLLEILGFGLIIPLLSKIIDFNETSLFENNFYLSYLKSLTIPQILFYLFLIFLIKNFLLILINYISSILEKNVEINFTKKMTNAYFEQIFSGGSSDSIPNIIRNMTVELKHFLHMTSAVFSIINDFIYASVMTLFLIKIIDKDLLFFLVCAFLSIALYYFFTRDSITQFGLKRLEFTKKFYKNILETFSLIKECFAYNKINIFRDKLIFNLNTSKSMDVRHKLLAFATKPLFEILMITSLIIYYWLFQNEDTYKESFILLVITLGVTFRLAPYIIKIITSINLVNYKKPSLEKLYIYLKEQNHNSYQKSKKKKVISLKLNNINFSFNKKKKIIKNFSLDIHAKNKIIIEGKSGLGKSTLIDLLMGFKIQNSGTISLNNKICTGNISNFFSYVPQRPYILNDNLNNNITLYNKNVDKKKIKRIVSLCDLKTLDQKYLNNKLVLGDNGSKISEGQKQKIGICRALYFDKEIYIFDESTANLDNKSEEIVIRNILKYLKNKIVIFITHNKKNYKFFDRVIKLS